MRPFLHRYGTHCCTEQVNTTEGCPKIDLFTFKGHDRVLHIGWTYGVHCKYIHCKNYSFSLCPVSRCTFAVFFYIEELPVVNHCIFYKIQQKSVKMTSEQMQF